MQPALIEALTELGLTRNAALAYLTLLEGNDGQGLTGYEVAARSGIPRSAVYNVLRQLEEAAGAFSVGDNPARFVATQPERLLEQMRRSTQGRLERLDGALRQLPARSRPEPIWTLSRYDQILRRVEQMIRSAEQSVYLSLWSRELELLLPVLREVESRTLHRVLHSPDRLTVAPTGFSTWQDELSADDGKSGWSHKALVVVDRREALIGGAEPSVDNQAVVTTNPSLVDVATNHIVLDITLLARRQGRDCAADVSPMMRPHLRGLNEAGA
jgi:HTH-type transcriptional regulator, sugar sensing transcriptional regulator